MSRVQSIERAFAVLSALGDGPSGVTTIAGRARLPKSTVARLLRALQAEEAVEQSPVDGRYRLGPRVVTLAAGLAASPSLLAIARPYLATLAEETGEAAGLSIPDGRDVHYVEQVGTPNPVSIRDWTGTRVPMHAVSSGQVFLAHASSSVVEAYLAGGLARLTPRTLTDPGCAARAAAGRPARRLCLGPRRVRRGHLVGGRGRRRWIRRGRGGAPRARAVVSLPAGRPRCRRGPPRRHDRGADRADAAPGGGVTAGAARDQWARRSLSRATPRRWPFSRYASLAAAHR